MSSYLFVKPCGDPVSRAGVRKEDGRKEGLGKEKRRKEGKTVLRAVCLPPAVWSLVICL